MLTKKIYDILAPFHINFGFNNRKRKVLVIAHLKKIVYIQKDFKGNFMKITYYTLCLYRLKNTCQLMKLYVRITYFRQKTNNFGVVKQGSKTAHPASQQF